MALRHVRSAVSFFFPALMRSGTQPSRGFNSPCFPYGVERGESIKQSKYFSSGNKLQGKWSMVRATEEGHSRVACRKVNGGRRWCSSQKEQIGEISAGKVESGSCVADGGIGDQ